MRYMWSDMLGKEKVSMCQAAAQNAPRTSLRLGPVVGCEFVDGICDGKEKVCSL